MARRKGHVGGQTRRIRPKAKENLSHAASPTQNNACKYKPFLAGVIFAILAVVVAFCAASSGSPRPSSSSIQTDNRQRRDAFLQWFVDNGGAFYPIDTGDGKLANVTIEEFDEYGGWGLALPVPPASSKPYECKSVSEEGNGQCLPRDDNPTPVIRHLDPLFTVPSSIIISVESIMETYANSDSPLFLSTFYPDVNNVLTNYFPHGTGLAKWGMGLPEQDAVVALYLMAEECQHRHPELFATEDSRWGPYLDVLPQSTVPRLDTFGDEEYAALQDEGLERTGRHSRRLLEQMHSRGANGASLQSVVREMIRKKMPTSAASIPQSCLSFEAFHRFVAIVSSRAMVLRGTKHLTPLAEMINYAPKEGSQDWIRAPFDLYHALSDDGSITVRSDRDIFLPTKLDGEHDVQIFEDYGPVDSSLFLEAHGFVPHENPNNCATISGSLFLRRNVASGRHDENAGLVLRALKALRLIHPDVRSFEALEDVCVRADLSLVDDGNTVGRRPASDSIAIASLLLGDGKNLAWDQIEADHGDTFASLKDKCAAAIHLRDAELLEIRCARYPGSKAVVKQALRTAAGRGIASFEANGDSEENLQLQPQKAEAEGRHSLALALRFRVQERKILLQIANASGELVLGSENAATAQATTTTEGLQDKLNAFTSFVESLELPLNKIEPKLTGDGMRVGAFATEDLEVDDAYISLGASSVIDVSSALAGLEDDSNLAALLKKHSSSENGQNDCFDALLLYLLHERFVLREQSRWWAYLALLPSVEEVREYHPLFIPEEEIDRHLAGSDVRRFVSRYQQRAADRHQMLASDLDANLVLGSDILLDRNKVLWATTILDSRSIWWDGMRHLSPLLDLVNADSIGRAHATTVEDSEDGRPSVAVTRASRCVQKGEQLFENYSQPNHLLFSFHGFLLEDNPNACALLGGLSIDSNDPGARFARQRSASHTFCIKGEDSLEELAHFLRMKHDLSRDNSSGLAIDDEVRPHLIQLMEERIARLTEAMDTATIDVATASSRVRFMRQMVQNDLMHFQHALAKLKPAAA
ncbi:hypothetical protein ACHAXT_010832 [Thalassiosira profunda]